MRGSRTRWGVVGAMAAGFGFSLFCAFTLPMFAAADEAPHYSYAVELSEGRLPTITTPMPAGDSPVLGRWIEATHSKRARRTIWVANHPPLYYAIAAPVVKVADAVGGDDAGPQSMRVLSSLCIALSIGAMALLAHEVFRGRSSLVVASAAITAALSYVAGTGGVGYNDAFGFLITVGTLAIAARMVRRGPSWPRVVGAAALVSAAALTRAELLLLVPVVLAAFALGREAIRDRESRRLLVRQAATIAGAPVILSAWFYIRNYDLYGSFTASSYLLDRFDRKPHLGNTLDVLRSDELLGRVTSHLFTSTPSLAGTFRAGGIFAGSWYSGDWRDGLPVALIVLGLALLGGLRAGVREARSRRERSRDELRWIGFVAVLVGYSVIVTVAVAHSVAAGHNTWARYFLPVLALLVIATIWGIDRLWPNRLLLAAVVAGMFLVESVVVFSLVGQHFWYPFIGMGAPGVSTLGQNIGRVIAIVGAVTAIAAIAWPTAKPETILDLTSDELEGAPGEVGDPGLEEREHRIVAGARGEPRV